MIEDSNNNTEKLSWNISAGKIGTIVGLIQAGETAWIEHNDVVKRHQCWQSVAVLIDNRLQPKDRKRLKELQKLVRDKSYSKNKYVSQWKKGSEEWQKNQYILNKNNMLLFSNVYIKFVNGLLKNIGMDIKSEDTSVGEID
jgi:hypothetical protein